MTRDTFAELRQRLDVRDLAEAEGLSRRGRHIDCPACGRKLKAMSRDGAGWFCVGCEAKGDAVDLLSLTRGVAAVEARRYAEQLAGIDRRPGAAPSPPPPRRLPPPPPPSLSPDDAEQRRRAVRLAADHYRTWLGVRLDEDLATPAVHARHLRWLGLSELECRRALHGAQAVRAYAERRLVALRSGASSPVADLIGACPARRSGLVERLRELGGPDLEQTAQRAGLLRADGTELLAGRLVYVWTDARGVAVYLTGRAVPDLTHADAPKVLALPVHGAGDRPETGVPRPGVPFGIAHALALAGPVVIVEGEAQAVAALGVGVAAVATGGVSRTPATDLARHLAGRELVVRFDLEADATKQARTDARAVELARTLGAKWIPPAVRAEMREGLA